MTDIYEEGRMALANIIKTCPFCGSEARHYHRPDDTGWQNTDWICCINEDCGCGTCVHESKELAVKAWNRRYKQKTNPYNQEIK